MSIVHTVTEGGQIWTHRFRMFKQVIKTTFGFALLVGVGTFLFYMLGLSAILYQGTWYYAKGRLLEPYVRQIEVDTKYWATATRQHYHGEVISIETKRVIQASERYATALEQASLEALKVASKTSNITAAIVLLFFLVFGKRSQSKQHLSGKTLSSAWRVALKLKLTRKASFVKIGSVPLVKGTESQHILITGGTGTGKTNCLHHILKQIRSQKQKTIIVDTTGTFVERYYEAERDVILSPFHPKTAKWNPWAECKTPFDYSEIAEAFVPHSYNEHENYWRQASRTVFSSLLQKFSDTKKTSELMHSLLYDPLASICDVLKGTKAASHMDIQSEKTASSIRSVTSTFLECMECLEDTDTPFAIRDWVLSEKQDSWLFLHCNPSQRASVRPLLSAWISSAIKGLLGLEPDLNRKIWFVIDEFPSLQKVKDIEVLLTEGRKYGGCGILSLQSPSQLENIYGRETTRTLIGNALTKIVFAEQDPEIAERISKSFGDCQLKEFQEGISYGAHETRDGVNLSSHMRYEPIVSSSKIMALQKNAAFLKLPGSYPIVKVSLKIARDGRR